MKIDKDDVYDAQMHHRMQASLGRSACMYAKRVRFHYCGFIFCFSLESSRIDWTCALCDGFPVHRGSLRRRLVRIASMECCPVRGSGSGPRRKRTIYRRATSARTVPSLPYPTLSSSSICVSVFLSCVSLI